MTLNEADLELVARVVQARRQVIANRLRSLRNQWRRTEEVMHLAAIADDERQPAREDGALAALEAKLTGRPTAAAGDEGARRSGNRDAP